MTDKNKVAMNLLETRIYNMVKKALTEAEDGDYINSEEGKKQYKAIQTALNDPKVNATQIMAKALGFSPDDDSERSYAFKKLHQEHDEQTGKPCSFNKDQLNKIFGVLSA